METIKRALEVVLKAARLEDVEITVEDECISVHKGWLDIRPAEDGPGFTVTEWRHSGSYECPEVDDFDRGTYATEWEAASVLVMLLVNYAIESAIESQRELIAYEYEKACEASARELGVDPLEAR